MAAAALWSCGAACPWFRSRQRSLRLILLRPRRRATESIPGAWFFSPDGTALVTERPGRMRLVGTDGRLAEPVSGLPAVDARGKGAARCGA
ncbi:MAG: PQQ-dependent sugar dehydrogenase [Proteobacteria bacterium]|nr:PQQ-dependent sugar dehydrogenase [Pseudomonadota bacterium]